MLSVLRAWQIPWWVEKLQEERSRGFWPPSQYSTPHRFILQIEGRLWLQVSWAHAQRPGSCRRWPQASPSSKLDDLKRGRLQESHLSHRAVLLCGELSVKTRHPQPPAVTYLPAYIVTLQPRGMLKVKQESDAARAPGGQEKLAWCRSQTLHKLAPILCSCLPHLAPIDPGTVVSVWGSSHQSSSPPGRVCHSVGKHLQGMLASGHHRTPPGHICPSWDDTAHQLASPGTTEKLTVEQVHMMPS